jgi:hypothetical protein
MIKIKIISEKTTQEKSSIGPNVAIPGSNIGEYLRADSKREWNLLLIWIERVLAPIIAQPFINMKGCMHPSQP